MLGLGPTELIIILVLVVIIFGAGKLPELGSSLGKSLREFKTSVREEEEPAPAPEAKPEKAAARDEAE